LNIIDILIMPWNNADIGDRVFVNTLIVLLISLIPVFYFSMSKKVRIKERNFNFYIYYVCVPIFAVIVLELLFWPLALVVNSLFMFVFWDKKSAKGMCFREKNGIGFRCFEVEHQKYYDEKIEYSKEELKSYFPNKLLYSFLVYVFPLLIVGVFSLFNLGYIFWM